MSRNLLPFLRPCLSRSFKPQLKAKHARVYNAIQQRSVQNATIPIELHTGPHDVEKQKRLEQLQKAKPLGEYHPRMVHPSGVDSTLLPREFCEKYEHVKFGDEKKGHQPTVTVFGRVRSVRSYGYKLMFLDIERNGERLQTMVQVKNMHSDDDTHKADLKTFSKVIRVGDWVSVTGIGARTETGQLTLSALFTPKIIAPCLHHLPDYIENAETLARRPHVHQLTSDEPGAVLRLRAVLYGFVRSFLFNNGFLEVETPMFDVNAGGAIARPFETVANEMSNLPIKLRIAPELNLKRLIIGGQDKVYEMGRAFRNEGVDNTHNPEFSTCEFYEVGATLPSLIKRTEEFLLGFSTAAESFRIQSYPSLVAPSGIDFASPFAQLPFVPTIEKAIGQKLPDLSSKNAADELSQLFSQLRIPLPPNATLPRLLDTLAEEYIEPLCQNPTFITHHPEALSPLSKSFLDEVTGQRVASRAELFIQGREYINTYEEENSPFEQRRKFMMQLDFHAEGVRVIDESYLEALEWGMPPTGGWGCGLDRFVMLFASKKRIADVLPFGTLRNVVSIAKNGRDGA